MSTLNPADVEGPRVPILGTLSHALTKVTAFVGALALLTDVLVVFASVIWRYALHSPLDWAEEVARALMITLVFCGVATSTSRGKHIGVDLFLGWLPTQAQKYVSHAGRWILVIVSAGLTCSSFSLVEASFAQTTETGLPQAIYVVPVLVGSFVMLVAALEHAFLAPRHVLAGSAAAICLIGLIGYIGQSLLPDPSMGPGLMMLACFILGIVAGVPIAFTLGTAAMVFFLSQPGLPFTFFAQQVAGGVDHFVLLAIPFFLLAGAAMEINGMSSRLVELIVRGMGRIRGGLGITTVAAMTFFSGISGSKLADIAAVGGVLMPAVRRSRQSSEEMAGLFAASAVMAEAIPPCVNLIVLGFVANISIGALFVAGVIPAAILMVFLLAAAAIFGKRVDVSEAYPVRMPMKQLIMGAAVGLVMILMIGRGVVAGIATSTEISAFAVVYAIVVGRLAFRELTMKATIRLFVDVTATSGMLLFIVAAAGSLSYSLTIQMIPQQIAQFLVSVGSGHGGWLFLLLTILMVTVFGAVLEGAPALIIFAPILVPIAAQLGYSPLHYGILVVLSMGLGLFSPPIGLGLYAICGVCGVQMKDVIVPMTKYLAVIVVGIIILAFVPSLTTWLPKVMGYG
ncbi:MAG TPA: TRAP transporter large permease subunit [Telmatospirillum sp.]|nr:TRAP transporter large permease subunit [Telmatospirillum sp.]